MRMTMKTCMLSLPCFVYFISSVMTTSSRSSSVFHMVSYFPGVRLITALVHFGVIIAAAIQQEDTEHLRRRQLQEDTVHNKHGIFTDERAHANAQAIQEWRERFREECEMITTTESIKSLLKHTEGAFSPSRIGDELTHENRLNPEPCQNVFLYVGESTAGSLGRFIEAGLPRCASADIENPNWDIDASLVRPERGQRDELRTWAQKAMGGSASTGSLNRLPENYCVYGIEDNHFLASYLERLERLIMRTTPRPVRRLHFFVDTALVPSDGTTFVFETDPTQATIQGRSLTSLMHGLINTYEYQQQQQQQQQHLMIQLDMKKEGSKLYAVLREAVESGVFDHYVNDRSVIIDLLLMIHPNNDEHNGSSNALEEETRQAILDCGVNLVVKEAI